MPFSGQLSLDDDDRPLEADVEFIGEELSVSTVAGPMGRWPLANCRIQPHDGRFLITIESDKAWFVPDEPARFTRTVLEHWGMASLATAMKAAREANGARPLQSKALEETKDGEDHSPSGGEGFTGLDAKRKWQVAGAAIGLTIVLLVAT